MIPGKVSGVPLVKGSREQPDTVLESYEMGASVEDIAYSYSLDPELIVLYFPMRGRLSFLLPSSEGRD